METKPNLVIIGVSGAGKTEVANAVSKLTNLPVHESNSFTTALAGQDADLIVVREGYDAHTQQSSAGALAALEQNGIIVLSPDVVLSGPVQAKLAQLKEKGVKVIELYADFNTLAQRTGINAPRSVSLGPTRRTFRLLVEAYREAYAQIADEKIDTSLSKPDFVAPRVVAFMG